MKGVIRIMIEHGINITKSRKVYGYLKEQSIDLVLEGLPKVSELSGNICVDGEIVGIFVNEEDIQIYDEFIKPNNLEIEVKDEEGVHILVADKDCVWRCTSCGKEIKVAQKHVDSSNNLLSPDCPKCESKMQFRYWLDCQD